MEDNFYMSNRQKLLFAVRELHLRGFGKLRVIPSLSPSGLSWRCIFVAEASGRRCIASTWLSRHEEQNSKAELERTIPELADLFAEENADFVEHCKGENEEYTEWYSKMLERLTDGELPYAFADWPIPKGIWKTSKDQEIPTLPDEEKYYY